MKQRTEKAIWKKDRKKRSIRAVKRKTLKTHEDSLKKLWTTLNITTSAS